jgi:hypothetical protein
MASATRHGRQVRWPAPASGWVAGIVALLLLSACAPTGVRPVAQSPYAFVVLGPEGEAVVRAITTAAECPRVEFDGRQVSMSLRAPAATVPQRSTRSTPEESKPAEFPVLTCEVIVPVGTRVARLEGRALPLPSANPQRILVIGDTGCRLKRSDAAFQACNDPLQFPLEAIARAAAATHPDLVLHMGDFHYRENACPPGNAGCAGSPWGYGWDAWEADLFAPMRTLLEAAPWVVIRGNHESCRRAGQGWWRFLDPRPFTATQDCNRDADDGEGEYSMPYAVPIGADTRLVVFDSSFATLAVLREDDPMFQRWRAQFTAAFALGARRPHTLFALHHPVLGYAPNVTEPLRPHGGNPSVLSVLEAMDPGTLFPASVDAVFAGHVHLLEATGFSTPHPPHFVVGNGGTMRDPALPQPFPMERAVAKGATLAALTTTDEFGFVVLDRAPEGWRATMHAADGRELGDCLLERRQLRCLPLRP